jgi:hypothetical protein
VTRDSHVNIRIYGALRHADADVEFIKRLQFNECGSLGREHRVDDANSFHLIELLIVRDNSEVINKSTTTIASNGINKLSYNASRCFQTIIIAPTYIPKKQTLSKYLSRNKQV